MSRVVLSMGSMDVLLDCAWCGDEVVFTVSATADELQCPACGTLTAIAPDPATTFALLYEEIAVAA